MKLILCLLIGVLFITHSYGVKIGVLSGAKNPGAQSIVNALEKHKVGSVVKLNKISKQSLNGLNVLIIPQGYDYKQKKVLRTAINNGLGVFFTHDSTGSGRRTFRGGYGTLPEVVAKPESNNIVASRGRGFVVAKEHPITKGLPKNFQQDFNDYVIMFPKSDASVLIVDKQYHWIPRTLKGDVARFKGTQRRWLKYNGGNAVLVASRFGQGRVVCYGGLLGYDEINRPNQVIDMKGAELTLLLNVVNWLSGKTAFGIEEDSSAGQAKDKVKYSIPRVKYDAGKIMGFTAPEKYFQVELSSEIEKNKIYEVCLKLSLPVPTAKEIEIVDKNNEKYAVYPVATDGKNIRFLGQLPDNKFRAIVRGTVTQKTMRLRVLKDRYLAEITGPDFKLVVAVEDNQATLQSIRISDWEWHHTWNGLERNSFSASLLRLSPTMWPFQALPAKLYHERGKAQINFDKSETYSLKHPYKIEFKLAKGSIKVFRSGQIVLSNFYRNGRIATWAFDKYRTSAGTTVPETVAHDMPEINSSWLWAVKDNRYALGGNFTIYPHLGTTGMSPGVMRKVKFNGNFMVLTNKLGKLDALSSPPKVTNGRAQKVVQFVVKKSPVKPVELKARKIKISNLFKKRGINRYYGPMAQFVEIYKDELKGNEKVVRWELLDTDSYALKPYFDSWYSRAVKKLSDQAVVKGMQKDDPDNEDNYVWRRFYIVRKGKPAGIVSSQKAVLAGFDSKNNIVIEMPLQIQQVVAIPRGIFTYYVQWDSYRSKCSPDQYPKVMRDIKMTGLNFVINQVDDQSKNKENTDKILERMQRYSLRWLAGFNGCAARFSRLHKDKKNPYKKIKNIEDLEKESAALFQKYRKKRNLLGWYLSDEIASGKVKDGKLPSGYQICNQFYAFAKKQAPKVMALNLISPFFTDYKSAVKGLKTDVFSWDKYGIGARIIVNDMKKVRALLPDKKSKPIWVTLRSSGPNWYDTLDLWFDIRTQAVAAYQGGVDSISYYKYIQFMNALSWRDFGIVTMGPKGPIAAPRRQAIALIMRDIEMLATAEYLVMKYGKGKKAKLNKQIMKLCALGVKGKFHAMRTGLSKLISKLTPKKD